ncbi:LysR family transcriptional regulator [Palleronia caenipelagi]|uniref:LysR family transcriptional regulator n=1 Tax=Palleronia caenipelagi TaxID=2489174 RepID=A0A547Q7X9_9RHOB|nr:LysR family transcriptional regulator [Palleronia caenipelagi]TRD22484.1 LysR family transcriptional regulator [Palleronia caenipelagi]
MGSWDEVKTAYHVARVGTVSGAADALGVHHATVIRHVDALEARLGLRLFHRHARGYVATDAGQDLLRVGQVADDLFSQLEARLRGQSEDLSGDLVVTTIDALGKPVLRALTTLQKQHPGLIVHLRTDPRVFRLEYGEAHVAVRAGPSPQEPDNVVQRLGHLEMGLFGSRDYLTENAPPEHWEDLDRHHFIGAVDALARAPFYRWLEHTVPPHAIRQRVQWTEQVVEAIRAGAGLGFLPKNIGENWSDLIEIFDTRDEWQAPLWLVSHVDLHRSAKVQAALNALKTHFSP